METITPFLMFTGQADAAMTFYTSLFSDAEVLSVTRYDAEAGEMAGKVLQARFRLNGQELRCFDSPPVHAFTFTPSFSLFVEVDSEPAIDRLFAAFSEGGQVMMPLDAYPFSPRFGWVSDRFGVSWQLTLKA